MVAAVAAAAIACSPERGLGTVSLTRGRLVVAVDLATCSERRRPSRPARAGAQLVSPDRRWAATIRARRTANGHYGRQTIVVRDRRTGAERKVLSVRESYLRAPAGAPGPLGLVGWSH